MKVLCLLQNAWGDHKLPTVFRPNPFNKSAKIMADVCAGHSFVFANTTGEVVQWSHIRARMNAKHMMAVCKRLSGYDVVIVCGKQALEAYTDHKVQFMAIGMPVIAMQHPASRTLTIVERNKAKHALSRVKPGKHSYTYINK